MLYMRTVGAPCFNSNCGDRFLFKRLFPKGRAHPSTDFGQVVQEVIKREQKGAKRLVEKDSFQQISMSSSGTLRFSHN